MSEAYEYTVRVGGNCCYYGQEDKVIPQPGDTLLIKHMCQCVSKIVGELKAGETAVCGQALYFDPADGCLTITPSAGNFYGIAMSGVEPVVPTEKCPIVVYTSGSFDVDKVVVDGGAVDAALVQEARALNIYFESRQ